MEQTKNETKIKGNTGNTAAPDNREKPKKECKPLTEAQRLQRQKMIVLPVMVLVFIGAIWLIFAPSSETEHNREREVTTPRCRMRTRQTAR